jgi:hypothetical protein
MASSYTKFNAFTDDLVKGVMNFSSDTFKILLTNNAPSASAWHVYGDVTGELATLNGYTLTGASSAITIANASGTETVTATAVTWTAVTGTMGPFRYAVIYDSTPATKTLIAWWDYGSAVTLAVGETFTVEPNSSPTTGSLFTLA